jgi:hypothetical protein
VPGRRREGAGLLSATGGGDAGAEAARWGGGDAAEQCPAAISGERAPGGDAGASKTAADPTPAPAREEEQIHGEAVRASSSMHGTTPASLPGAPFLPSERRTTPPRVQFKQSWRCGAPSPDGDGEVVWRGEAELLWRGGPARRGETAELLSRRRRGQGREVAGAAASGRVVGPCGASSVGGFGIKPFVY